VIAYYKQSISEAIKSLAEVAKPNLGEKNIQQQIEFAEFQVNNVDTRNLFVNSSDESLVQGLQAKCRAHLAALKVLATQIAIDGSIPYDDTRPEVVAALRWISSLASPTSGVATEFSEVSETCFNARKEFVDSIAGPATVTTCKTAHTKAIGEDVCACSVAEALSTASKSKHFAIMTQCVIARMSQFDQATLSKTCKALIASGIASCALVASPEFDISINDEVVTDEYTKNFSLKGWKALLTSSIATVMTAVATIRKGVGVAANQASPHKALIQLGTLVSESYVHVPDACHNASATFHSPPFANLSPKLVGNIDSSIMSTIEFTKSLFWDSVCSYMKKICTTLVDATAVFVGVKVLQAISDQNELTDEFNEDAFSKLDSPKSKAFRIVVFYLFLLFACVFIILFICV